MGALFLSRSRLKGSAGSCLEHIPDSMYLAGTHSVFVFGIIVIIDDGLLLDTSE